MYLKNLPFIHANYYVLKRSPLLNAFLERFLNPVSKEVHKLFTIFPYAFVFPLSSTATSKGINGHFSERNRVSKLSLY